MVTISSTFVATGCAQRSQVLVWSTRGFVVYASAGDLVVAKLRKNEAAARILSTTAAHEAHITCVTIDDDFIRSGDAQGNVAVWKLSETGVLDLLSRHDAHPKHPITSCTGLGDSLTASSASDGRLLIRRSAEKQQELKFGSTFVLCTAFYRCAEGELLLAAATSNSKVEILYEENEEFKRGITLTGHSDWVRSMAFRGDSDGSFICASAGQDSVIRMYKFQNEQHIPAFDPSELRVRPLKLEITPKLVFHVTVEAVLSGHEGWIHSVQWHPTLNRLLSASMDKCLIVWEPSDDGHGVWLEKVRVGEVGGQAVGFYGAVFANEGLRIVGHSYFGGIYIWHPENELNPNEIIWLPEPAFGGHFSNVVDIDWDPSGSYLISCSSDQTTRTYAPICAGSGHAEIGRPQVHGHNLNCLIAISSSTFVSGAEEKIFRAFRAPKTFANSLANISGVDKQQIFEEELSEFGAGVPSLGLSNKAIEEGEVTNPDDIVMGGATKEEIASLVSNPVDLTEPPTEDHLMQNTLWPEIHKLYGHGFEVFAIAANKQGTIIATSCKASQTDHAVVMIWDTKEWQRRCDLFAHQLTVTQMDFAPSGKYFLSVSRDRTFAVFKSESDFEWTKVFQSTKSTGVHSRIIWACSWSHDSELFATVSRDKKMAIWRIGEDDSIHNVGVISLEDSITAVQFAPGLTADGKYALATGLDNGTIQLHTFDLVSRTFENVKNLDRSKAHSRTVRRLRFRPIEGAWQSASLPKVTSLCWELASCGDDHCVKVHRIEWTSTDC
ncbi:hypothetical protein L596_017156 [Steinernema carpocapsae]|uniref:Elongator complex protein 2 n=1 Tax=Steinernema carpocapsae TaxID=34508 RepID=A0A4U5N0R6_STECR|nr:hypothetical protein L596_017156 [Steinernema carpocapsae]